MNTLRLFFNLIIFCVAGYCLADCYTKGNIPAMAWLLTALIGRFEVYMLSKENIDLKAQKGVLERIFFHIITECNKNEKGGGNNE